MLSIPDYRCISLIRLALLAVALTSPIAAPAYTPGSGTLFSDDFEGTLDDGWEMESGYGTASSPWTQETDGADTSLYADGYGPFGGSATLHRASHFVHPTEVETFSTAFEFESELGSGYYFDLEVEQKAPIPRKYRLRIDGDGAMSLWRTVGGTMTRVVSSPNRTVSARKKRWLRFAIESDPSGHPLVRARVWSSGATAEPSLWTVEFLDDQDILERVHALELVADGPPGIETWIDDLDVWGETGNGVASSIRTIYIVEHSHIDIGFTKPPDDIEVFAKIHLDQVMDNLDTDPDYFWTIENGWCLDRWWERSTGTEHDRMIGYLQSGRIRQAANYTNLTTTVTSQEELSRSVYWACKMGRQYGFPVRTWYQDDVPGATFALPGILARAGIEYYIGGMNATFGGALTAPDHGDQPFWWVGPGGERVLSWISFDSYTAAFNYGFSFFDTLADMYEKLGSKLPEMEEAGYPYPELMLQRAFDNHYQGFHARNLVNQWNQTYEAPVFVLATAEDFLDHMLATYGPESFPSYSGDFGSAWGGLTAYAPTSCSWIRQAHREGRAGEALLAAGASVDGETVPHSDIDFMYRRMHEFDEHTNAGGWSGYYTHEEMERHNRIHLGYAQDARDYAGALLDQGIVRALTDLSAEGDAVVAVNTLGRSRDGWVRLTLPASLYNSTFRVIDRGTGTETAYQRFDGSEEILFRALDVPAMGYRVFDLVPGEPSAVPPGMLAVTATTLENDHYLLEIDPDDGSVAGMYHKPSGIEMIDTSSSYRFNELAVNTHQESVAKAAPLAKPPASAAVSIEWDGPMAASLRVTRTGTSHVETAYRLYRGEDRVEIENLLDRDLMDYVPNSMHSILHFVTMPFDIHDFDIRSSTATRYMDPVTDSFQRTELFDEHGVEHTIAFWDDTFGVQYAIDSAWLHHFDHVSKLTSPAFTTGDAMLITRLVDKNDEYEYEGGVVDTFVMEPGTSPVKRFTHHMRATDPSFDPVAADSFGVGALMPLVPHLLERRPGNLPDAAASWFSVDAPGVYLYTVKKADDDDGIILRMKELTGQQITAVISSDILNFLNGERVEEDEERGEPLPMAGNDVQVELGPYETVTVRVRTAVSWSPVTLYADKNGPAGEVILEWSDGVSPYTLKRSLDPAYFGMAEVLVDEEDVISHADPVLDDGLSYYYIVQ